MMRYRPRMYSAGGVPLTDPRGRWFTEAATQVPGTSGCEIPEVPGGAHGVGIPRRLRRTAATLDLSIVVTGKTDSDFRQNYADLMRLFSAWESNGVIDLSYDDGSVVAHSRAILAAEIKPERVGLRKERLPISLSLPDPFWYEDESAVMRIQAGVPVDLDELFGGSAPVEPVISVSSSDLITGIDVIDMVTGRRYSWGGSSRSVVWDGWRIGRSAGQWDKRMGASIEDAPVLFPDVEGSYRARIDVAPASARGLNVSVEARRAFQ